MTTIKQRLEALEQNHKEGHAGELPLVVPDDTTDVEIARLSRNGRQAVRYSDAPDLFV